MNKEFISTKQGIIFMSMFIFGTSSIQITGTSAKQDAWIAIILAMILTVPVFFAYSTISTIFPGKDVFECSEICFGKFLGKLIMLLIVLFIWQTSSEVLKNYGMFLNTVALPETPVVIPEIVMMLFCIWIIKCGLEVMGRWSELFIIILVFFLIITIILLTPYIDTNNLTPFLYKGFNPVMKGAFEALMFPLTETISFIIIYSFKSKISYYKSYFIGLFIGTIFLITFSLINILTLGLNHSSSLYHPTYFSVAKIKITTQIQHFQIVSGAIFTIGAFMKISIYLLGVCRGIARIFELNDYRFIVTPVGITIVLLSEISFSSVMQFWEWTGGEWNYYALVFQILLPIFICSVAFIKKYLLKNLRC